MLTATGLECSFVSLRGSVVNIYVLTMMGPFILSAILIFLSGIQHLFKVSCTEETRPLLKPNHNILREYKAQCLSIFLYTSYFLYYGLSTAILQNMTCSSVKCSKFQFLHFRMNFLQKSIL